MKEFLNKINNTKDPQQLRTYLQEVESEIKGIVGEDPFYFYPSSPSPEIIDRIEALIGNRRYILDRMFTYSEDEIKRMEQVNALLFNLTKQMYQRTTSLYRMLLKYGQDDSFDDDYEVEGVLNHHVEYSKDEGDLDSVLHLENDDVYGSDFAYMIYVMRENDELSDFHINYIDNCFIYHRESNTPEMTDKELDCDYTFMDDGESWGECLWRNDLKHICFCHAFHSLYTHHSYSLQDIIRINAFSVDVKLTCQRITDQKGRRWAEMKSEESL